MIGLAMLVAACAPAPGGGGPTTTTFLIPAGEHYATNSPVTATTADSLTFDVRFDDSAIYTSVLPENQFDINKLRGMSDCETHHHTNSARVGWRWTGSAIELSAYTYVNGVRSSTTLGQIQPNGWYSLSIAFVGSTYEFTLDGQLTVVPRGCAAQDLVKYDLWPYFGGDEVAPHPVTIEITQF